MKGIRRKASPGAKKHVGATLATTTGASKAVSADRLFERVSAILEDARGRIVREVNTTTVTSYWLIGREIVEALQGGAARAKYGARLLEELSVLLAERYGKGFSLPNLKSFRQFYLAYVDHAPVIGYPVGSQSLSAKKSYPAGSQSPVAAVGFQPTLSWSHYRALMRVEKPEAREFYEQEAVACGWSKVQLERQIDTLHYERLLMSRDKKGMLQASRKQAGRQHAVDALKDPYVLEFLDLPEAPSLHESTLESAIIANLQSFLLELGKGFSFVARQKRLRFSDSSCARRRTKPWRSTPCSRRAVSSLLRAI